VYEQNVQVWRFVVGTGAALAALGCVSRRFRQTSLQQHPCRQRATSAAIPLDQQPTKEQLAKLFELIRVANRCSHC